MLRGGEEESVNERELSKGSGGGEQWRVSKSGRGMGMHTCALFRLSKTTPMKFS